MSCGIGVKLSAICGMNLRIVSCRSRKIVRPSALDRRLSMSFVTSVSSAILRCYSALTV